MIVDTSAIVAIFRREDEFERFALAIELEPECRISSAVVLELAIALSNLEVPILADAIEMFMNRTQIEVLSFTPSQALVARSAHYRFGKNSGSRAKLNFGDCITYALAKERGEPLLFKGGDFNHTDVRIDERSVVTGEKS